MIRKRKPICFIIAGPNGAGKTTFALQYLPKIANCRNFVNADLIADGLSPLAVLSSQYDAGRLFLQEINNKIHCRANFAFETTLAGRSYITLLQKMRQNNWQIVLFFLWIPSASFSEKRVAERVKQGGHDVPKNTIYRRYPKIMHNLIKNYMSLCDKIICYNNSGLKPKAVFEKSGKRTNIFCKDIYDEILRQSDEQTKEK